MNRSTSDIIIKTLEEKYPEATCALEYDSDAWKLLIMSILSAQCTDKRVNAVSKKLFEHYPTPQSMSGANVEDIEKLIKECGLFHAKAKSIISSSKDLVERFDGNVPDNIDDLLTLRGVGRKIANLIVGDVYHKPAVVCDTHCIRLSSRLGYTPPGEKDPVKTERKLKSIIPEDKQSDFCHRLVMFGREICTARNPSCKICPLNNICKFGKTNINKSGVKNG